jgi:hypothetical protein
MNEMKRKMISQARETFKTIYPCGNKTALIDCFTKMGNKLVFWFNTEDQSTHLLALPLDDPHQTA